MNERDNFIVEDLDDFHVIIKADEEYRVRKQLEVEVRRYLKLCLRKTALMFLSVGKEHVQFRMMRTLPNNDKRCVYTNPGSSSRLHIPVASSLSSEGT